MNFKREYLKKKKKNIYHILKNIDNYAIFQIDSNNTSDKNKFFKLINNKYSYLSIDVNSYNRLKLNNKNIFYQNVFIIYKKQFFTKTEIKYFLEQTECKFLGLKLYNKIYTPIKLKQLITLNHKKVLINLIKGLYSKHKIIKLIKMLKFKS